MIGVAEVMELIFPQTGRELTGIVVVEEKATLSCQNQRECFEPITTQSYIPRAGDNRELEFGIYALSFSLQVGLIKRFGIYAYPNSTILIKKKHSITQKIFRKIA